jgi:two-component system chemotaxis sensor kinase CheA
VALDMAKYRLIFLEESSDHLGEISRALFDLEKEMASADAIDTIFRMAHSIKSMAASLGYDPVSELSHRLEDRMEGVRAAGRVRSQEELALLFRSLEALESMVAAVSREEEPPAADDELLGLLAEEAAASSASEASPSASEAASPDPVGGEPKKVRH